MELLQSDKRTLAIAANLLYRYGGSTIHVQMVEYDLFHLLVSIDDECNTRYGVVVAESNILASDAYKNYLDVLNKRVYTRDNPDNVPILLVIVDTIFERARIGVQLGWCSAFTPIVYNPITLKQMDNDWCEKLYTLVKAMNSTITMLSSEYLSIQKTIDLNGIHNNGFRFSGVILYARTIIPHIPQLTAKTKKQFEEDTTKYIYSPKFENDELDNEILECTRLKFANVADVNQRNDKLLFTSSDVQDLQFFGKELGGYNKFRIKYSLLPTIDINGENWQQYITPISLHNMTLCIREPYNKQWAHTFDHQVFTSNVNLGEWVKYSELLNKKSESMIDLFDYII